MEILVIASVLTGALVFCWYVSPYRRTRVTKGQYVLATTWLIVRRVVCVLGAVFCIGVIGLFAFSDVSWQEKVSPIIIFTVLLLTCVYVGIVGQGWVQNSFSDDLQFYRKIKERYKWRG